VKRILFLALAAFAFAALPARADNTVVVIETSMGTIKVELLNDKAPTTVKNFLVYVDDKFYDNTIFHRVMGKENSDYDFMIQGGGLTAKEHKEKDTKAAIKNESDNGVLNKRGTIAMARTGKPDSATAQFYVNVGDNSFLDRANARDKVGYCVFGKVTEGMDVVDKIKAVKTGRSKFIVRGPKGLQEDEYRNCPVEDVVIKSIRRAK